MAITEKQLDALDKQHQEMLQNYAKKVAALQATEARLTQDIKNLNKVIDDHVAEKKKELNEKIASTEKIKLEAVNLKKEAQELLYSAQAKHKEASEIHESLTQASKEHFDKVTDHVNSVSSANRDIDLRLAECAAKEEKIKSSILESEKAASAAIIERQKANDEISRISSINESIKADIETQKEIYFTNRKMLDDIRAEKEQIIAIKSKSDADIAESIRMRDDVDKAQARLEKASQELIKRTDECKAREVQIKVTEQTLKERKASLDAQEGRLNELKNNVNTLLEKQQASMPKEGA